MRKSFFNRDTCAVTSLISYEETIGGIRQRIAVSAEQGADAIALEMPFLPPEQRTVEQYRILMDTAPDLPFMFLLYRNDKWYGGDDEGRQKFLLDAVAAGAEVVDVMGDLFDPEPYELAVKPEAIARQKALIDDIHARGAKVIMSSHISVPRTSDEVLAHLQAQASRGADILKIVTLADTEEDFLEAIRTTMLLKKELDRPFVHLCGGAYGRLHRVLAPKLGVSITFAAQTECATSQPTVPQFRAVLDNIHWPPAAD